LFIVLIGNAAAANGEMHHALCAGCIPPSASLPLAGMKFTSLITYLLSPDCKKALHCYHKGNTAGKLSRVHKCGYRRPLDSFPACVE